MLKLLRFSLFQRSREMTAAMARNVHDEPKNWRFTVHRMSGKRKSSFRCPLKSTEMWQNEDGQKTGGGGGEVEGWRGWRALLHVHSSAEEKVQRLIGCI